MPPQKVALNGEPENDAHALMDADQNGSSGAHERESDSPPMPRTAERPATGRRTMRAWAAAQDEPKGPGLFARIGGLFRRKPAETAAPFAEPVIEETAPSSRPSRPASLDLVQIEALGANVIEPATEAPGFEPAPVVEDAAAEEESPIVEESAVAEEAPASVAPPQDFSFPWSRLGTQSTERPPQTIEDDFSASAEVASPEAMAEPEPGSSDAELDQAMSSVQEMAEDTSSVAKPGFFERLFGRRRKTESAEVTEPPVEAQIPEEPSVEFAEEPAPEQEPEAPQGDVDERYEAALRGLRKSMGIAAPAAAETEITDTAPAEVSEEPAPIEEAASDSTFDDFAQSATEEAEEIQTEKPGFFGRLFGRKKNAEPEVAEAEPTVEPEAVAEHVEEHEQVEEHDEQSVEFVEGVAYVAPESEPDLPFIEGSAFAAPSEEAAPAKQPQAIEEIAPAFDAGATQDFVETPLAEAFAPEATLNPDQAAAFDPEATLNPEEAAAFDPDTTLDPDAAPAAFDPEATLDPDAAPAAFDPDATLDPNEAPVAFDPESTLDPAEAVAFDPSATQPYEEPTPADDFGATTQEVDNASTLELDRAAVEAEVERATVAADVVSEDQLGSTGEMPKKASLIARLFGKSQEKTGEMAPVPADDGEVSFLIAKYRAFYTEIIRAQEHKAKLTGGFSTAIMSEAAVDETSPENAASELGWHLQQILELQTAEANWMRGEAQEKYPEAQYAMVALADELFHVVEWQGQSAWPRHGLEAKLFHSYSAHVEFFNRIDKMLRDPMPTKGTKDIARIYLMVLASGFEGMYREPGLKRPLAEYRRRLYEFIHGKFALDIYEPERKLIPQTMTNLLAGKAVGRFTQAQRWTVLVIILIAAYTFVAHLAWNTMTADLKDVTARIEALTSGPGAR